jgi:predicted transposase YbfD/YdcC
MAANSVTQIAESDNASPQSKVQVIPLDRIFEGLTDERKRRGKVYTLTSLCLLLLLGLMCGKRGPTSIARWFRKLPFLTRIRLRFPLGRSPAPATLCRLLQDLDVLELERNIRLWVLAVNTELAAAGRAQRIALDGKTLRVAAKRGAEAAHLLAAFSHELKTVLGQVAVEHKTNEINLVVDLLDQLVVAGRLLTMDALLTQRKIAQEIIDRQGDYLMIVKKNQPQLHEDIRMCFDEEALRDEARRSAQTTSKGHGRLEVREIVTSSALKDFLDWPGLEQVLLIRRIITKLKTDETRTEEVYAITSLPPERGSPEDLLAANRGHWGIENSLHWIRDVTLGEDHCPICKKDAPQAFAALRNLMLALMRWLGHTNMAAAIDLYSARPESALITMGVTTGT